MKGQAAFVLYMKQHLTSACRFSWLLCIFLTIFSGLSFFESIKFWQAYEHWPYPSFYHGPCDVLSFLQEHFSLHELWSVLPQVYGWSNHLLPTFWCSVLKTNEDNTTCLKLPAGNCGLQKCSTFFFHEHGDLLEFGCLNKKMVHVHCILIVRIQVY